jgi:flagellar L-ring protein precursor FlgH
MKIRCRHGVCVGLATFLALLIMAGAADADSLWIRAEKKGLVRSLYSDSRAYRVGDVVYISVLETTTATNSAETGTNRTSSTTNDAGTGLLSFLPFFTWKNNEQFKSDGSTVRKGGLTGRMTARLIEEITPGVFRIEGTREVAVNSETQKMTLSGIIRACDIAADNSVRSDQVADASIHYSGVGPVAAKQKPGILTRLFNWLF